MIDTINDVFWWIGMVVSVSGSIVMSFGLFILLGYACFALVANYRAAGFVICMPRGKFDFWLYRKLYRFKQTVSFILKGVPSEMVRKDGVIIFRREWLAVGSDDGK